MVGNRWRFDGLWYIENARVLGSVVARLSHSGCFAGAGAGAGTPPFTIFGAENPVGGGGGSGGGAWEGNTSPARDLPEELARVLFVGRILSGIAPKGDICLRTLNSLSALTKIVFGWRGLAVGI